MVFSHTHEPKTHTHTLKMSGILISFVKSCLCAGECLFPFLAHLFNSKFFLNSFTKLCDAVVICTYFCAFTWNFSQIFPTCLFVCFNWKKKKYGTGISFNGLQICLCTYSTAIACKVLEDEEEAEAEEVTGKMNGHKSISYLQIHRGEWGKRI